MSPTRICKTIRLRRVGANLARLRVCGITVPFPDAVLDGVSIDGRHGAHGASPVFKNLRKKRVLRTGGGPHMSQIRRWLMKTVQ